MQPQPLGDNGVAAVVNQPAPPLVHHGIVCDVCLMNPIVGIRFKCGNCADYDLCERCAINNNQHDPLHTLLFLNRPHENLVGAHNNPAPLLTKILAQAGHSAPFKVFDVSGEPQVQIRGAAEPGAQQQGATETGGPLPIRQLVDQQQESDWMLKSVGMGTSADARVVDPNLRNCYVFCKGTPSLVNQDGTTAVSSLAMDQTIHMAAQEWKNVDNDRVGYTLEDGELLVYPSPGGHFCEHQDRLVYGQEQLGTLLLIGYSHNAKGGDLVCRNRAVVSADMGQVYSSSSTTQLPPYRWKGCLLHPNEPHSVSPMESGLRVVFKALVRLHLNKDKKNSNETTNETTTATATTAPTSLSQRDSVNSRSSLTRNQPVHYFLSHSGKDKPIALCVARLLRQHQRNCWLDVLDCRDHNQTIYRAIDDCQCFVAVVSASYFQSKWCLKELGYAEGTQQRIVCLRLETPPPTSKDEMYLKIHPGTSTRGLNQQHGQDTTTITAMTTQVFELFAKFFDISLTSQDMEDVQRWWTKLHTMEREGTLEYKEIQEFVGVMPQPPPPPPASAQQSDNPFLLPTGQHPNPFGGFPPTPLPGQPPSGPSIGTLFD